MQKGNILVVEDDQAIRDAMCLALECYGYHTHPAGNGQEGLEILNKIDTPCLILLDLMMPLMNGWTFAEALSHDKKLSEIPVIVVTAFPDRALSVKNVRAVIKKPVEVDMLLKTAGEFCG